MMYYYLITAALALISLGILVIAYESKKTNYYFLIILLLLAFSNAGYLAIAISTDLKEAVLANKLCYLGGCFMPTVGFFLACELCKFELPHWVKGILYGYSALVYGMVLSIGYSKIYYSEIWIEKFRDVSVLGHDYGPGHMLFNLILYGYLLVQAILLVYSFIRKKSVSRKNLYALLAMSVVTIILFVGGRVMIPQLEIMPLVYVVDGWIFLYMYRRGVMYSIEDGLVGALERQELYGYIMFDRHANYLGCNDIGLRIFPQLSECTVDRSIRNVNGLGEVTAWISDYLDDERENFNFEQEGHHYECRITPIWYRNKVCGFMIEMREDTEKWQYMELLAKHNSELEHFQEILEEKVREQTKELRQQQNRIQEMYAETVTALSEAVDAKDRYTSGHSRRVAEYARMIAKRMGKSTREQEEIYYAGILHDVGKIRIPAEIINKPGKLTDEEFGTIKIHPVTGHHILRGISDNTYIAWGARYHHERYDGKGYPDGLTGDKIPEVARILGVADAYDAMASNRSYRSALPQEVVRAEIERGKGTQFDPAIADIMLQLMKEDTEYSMRQADVVHKRILTVDDETMNHKIIAHIMQDEPQYEIVSAESGRIALNLLEEQSFDLILLDVRMPDLDGLETLKLIREKYDTPVVMMTGDKNADLSGAFSEHGCNDYITKPFLPLLVQEVVHNMTK